MDVEYIGFCTPCLFLRNGFWIPVHQLRPKASVKRQYGNRLQLLGLFGLMSHNIYLKKAADSCLLCGGRRYQSSSLGLKEPNHDPRHWRLPSVAETRSQYVSLCLISSQHWSTRCRCFRRATASCCGLISLKQSSWRTSCPTKPCLGASVQSPVSSMLPNKTVVACDFQKT